MATRASGRYALPAARVLVTGMSGTGKSTVLAELARRGHAVLDTDEPGWIVAGAEPLWDLDRLRARLEDHRSGHLYLAGCVANQGDLYDRFDAVVLLSAPLAVLLARVADRDNPYGASAADRARIAADVAAFEPRLRAGAGHEIVTSAPVADVAAELERIAGSRIVLRPFTAADVGPMAAVYGDPEVMRHVGTGVVGTREGIARMLRAYAEHQARHGFSVWGVVERATGELIGDAGLYVREDSEVELGYTLRRDRWGRGLATEAAGACVDAAFGRLGLTALVAQTDLDNAASARVLETLGFAETDRRVAFGRPHRGFRLTAGG